MNLGTQLGIPEDELEAIQTEALQMPTNLREKKALEKMVTNAFRRHVLTQLPTALVNLVPRPTQDRVRAIKDLVTSAIGIHSILVHCVCVCVCVCVYMCAFS